MSAIALITGKLFRDPQRKVSGANKPYVLATMRVGEGKDSRFWQVMVFGEDEAEELMRLQRGDSLAVSGSMRVDVYLPEGKPPRPSLSVFADRVISHRRPKREIAIPADSVAHTIIAESEKKHIAFDDSIPF